MHERFGQWMGWIGPDHFGHGRCGEDQCYLVDFCCRHLGPIGRALHMSDEDLERVRQEFALMRGKYTEGAETSKLCHGWDPASSRKSPTICAR